MTQLPERTCPICSRPSAARFAPFCSGRCADVDLSRWFKGSYAIPGAADDDEDGAPNPHDEPA